MEMKKKKFTGFCFSVQVLPCRSVQTWGSWSWHPWRPHHQGHQSGLDLLWFSHVHCWDMGRKVVDRLPPMRERVLENRPWN